MTRTGTANGMGEEVESRYAKARAERQARVDAVVKSKSRKKVVVAGPGTGKTFLFKEILKDKKKSLTLTFVNSLVEDLSLELCGLSEVRTLHGFARGVMSQAVKGGVKIYPKLSKLIHEDAEILKGTNVDFDSLFHNRDDANEYIPFYKARRFFYGHYGFADIIYAAVLYLELKAEKIPALDQVLIDEFQDFNRLEVSLIDLLASRNPILLAGDDDQSLYYFKEASPSHIRLRYNAGNQDYEAFNLPHCSRCTSVIVGAINDIITAAKVEGFLKDRIDKPYIFFEDEKKEKDCKLYPKITHVTCYANQVPYFIEKSIKEIAEERREKFSVLIISPTRSRCRSIANALADKGLENIQHVDGDRDNEPTLMDALGLLAEDVTCNLGWRIAARCVLPDDDFKALLKTTDGRKEKLVDLVSKDAKAKIKSLLRSFKKIADGNTIKAEQFAELLTALKLDEHVMAHDVLRRKMLEAKHKASDPAIRNVPVKITTIPSSKGLAEDYVFITDFDDRFFLEKGKCSDQKIFDVLVALTRARKKAILISSEAKEPKFLTWIAKDRIDRIKL